LDHGSVVPGQGSRGAKIGGIDQGQSGRAEARHDYFMPFYRFHLCDPVNRVDGHDHGGAALADDIDAMLYAAGIVQRLVQQQPGVPRNWAIEVSRESRQTCVLSFEAGLKVMLRPHWACDQPSEAHEGWG
jgi:hypothetical protein